MAFIEVVEAGDSPRPYPVPVGSQIGGWVILYGYSIKESTGVAGAEVDIFDGADNRGLLSLPIPLAAGQGAEDWFGPQGIHLRNGLFSATVGAVIGSLFVHLVQDETWARADRMGAHRG